MLEQIEITDEELNSFLTAIKTRFGIDFTFYEKKSLKRGINRVITKNNMKSLMDLWSKILKDREVLTHYIDELLVNLTEFFRKPDFWQILDNQVFEKLKFKAKINIWHAGCSTGEEVYSMTILLKEKLLFHKTSLLATDLSTKALEFAKLGAFYGIVYKKATESYLQYNPKGNFSKYFNLNDTEFIILEDNKKNIEFLKHNLVQDKIDKKFNLILCRNVMIYFDDVFKMKVLKLFYDSLEDDGFFVIGYYDMMPEAAKDLFEVFDAQARIYVKKKR